jgi:AmiR/NasT family two-component response regulator
VPSNGEGLGPQLGRSILELVHAQSLRLQQMAAELDTARASLNERKLVERAKGLLMAHRHLSEDDAHKLMRHMAMSQNRRLVDVAQAVLSMADVLPVGPR